jgi:hypothetical protein
MRLPQYPAEVSKVLDDLQQDTNAHSTLFFHLDGTLCAAEGKYTDDITQGIITGARNTLFPYYSRELSTRRLPSLAFNQAPTYGLFSASVGQTHLVALPFLQAVPAALVKKLLLRACKQLEQLVPPK